MMKKEREEKSCGRIGYSFIFESRDEVLSYLVRPEAGRHPRVLLERAAAVIVALRVPLMMHQCLLESETWRGWLHGTLEGFLVRRTDGPALESHRHGHRRTGTEAKSRRTARLRRSPLMFLPGTPAASAHFPETTIRELVHTSGLMFNRHCSWPWGLHKGVARDSASGLMDRLLGIRLSWLILNIRAIGSSD